MATPNMINLDNDFLSAMWDARVEHLRQKKLENEQQERIIIPVAAHTLGNCTYCNTHLYKGSVYKLHTGHPSIDCEPFIDSLAEKVIARFPTIDKNYVKETFKSENMICKSCYHSTLELVRRNIPKLNSKKKIPININKKRIRQDSNNNESEKKKKKIINLAEIIPQQPNYYQPVLQFEKNENNQWVQVDEFMTIWEVNKQFDIKMDNVIAACNNWNIIAGGFKWQFKYSPE